jgi:dTMP kinase
MGGDLYESFINYQKRLLEEYKKLAQEYDFQVIDATLPVEQINEQLKQGILPLLPQG